ncbi:hypothetical protein H5410_055742 [Solanum commersonii]|uniref:Uncharacterized protein n=1 Tax=Solanum commersonii TaxID=4109 RepID=A0A9J5WKQ1_SOLCO|nr:hypothetical protein H5410_055742 [Solanum commersonii]
MLPPKPAIPALLNMMSNLPFHSTATFTADSTSSSFETSHSTKKILSRLKWLYIQIYLRIYMLRLELEVPEQVAGIPQ